MSSTSHLETLGEISGRHSSSHSCSKWHKNTLGSTGSSGEPTATQSICAIVDQK